MRDVPDPLAEHDEPEPVLRQQRVVLKRGATKPIEFPNSRPLVQREHVTLERELDTGDAESTQRANWKVMSMNIAYGSTCMVFGGMVGGA